MLVQPVDLQPLMTPAVWAELASLAVAWAAVAAVCAGATLVVAARMGWLR